MQARSRRAALVVLVGTALLATTACSTPSASTTPVAPAPSSSSAASTTSFRGVSVEGAAGRAPTVLIGDETASTSSIQVKDVIAGDGPMAGPTSKVTVQYVARGARTKRTFDSSWERGAAFSYDPKQVAFAAFVDGVPGMRVGGRRIVIVPGSLAFGARPPAGSGLQPNETVVFVIDLVRTG